MKKAIVTAEILQLSLNAFKELACDKRLFVYINTNNFNETSLCVEVALTSFLYSLEKSERLKDKSVTFRCLVNHSKNLIHVIEITK